jgi:hypothetical protein
MRTGVLIEKKWGCPLVGNDGVTTVREFELEDRKDILGALFAEGVANDADIGETVADALEKIGVEGADVPDPKSEGARAPEPEQLP